MQIRFVGGPYDGQTHVVDQELSKDTVIYWPPDATRGVVEDRVPGDDNLTEYLYAGDGTAQYVGGLVGDADGPRH